MNLRDVIASPGQTSRVTCTVSGETFDSWYGPDDKKVSAATDQGVHVESNVLVIKNPVVANTGVYKCKGSQNSATFTLYLLSKY